MERSSSQYDSFLFWRQPIPELDLSELEDVGQTDSRTPKCSKTRETPFQTKSPEDEGALSEFSSFNFWRAPLADVDALLADLHLLL